MKHIMWKVGHEKLVEKKIKRHAFVTTDMI